MIRFASSRSRSRASLVAVLVALTMAAAATSAEAGARDGVTVSAEPSSVQVTGLPCDQPSVDLTMINTTSEGRFADLVVAGEEPLVLSRDLFSTWLPATDPDQPVTAPLGIFVPRGTEPGQHDVTLTLDRKTRGTFVVEVVEPAPKGETDNLLADELATTSSTHGNFATCALVDGNVSSDGWPEGGWNDGTRAVWPDTIDVTIPEARTISRVVLSTLDSVANPAERFGLSDWDVQLRVDGEWTTVAEVRDNVEGQVTSTFPAAVADGVRIIAYESNSDDYARIIELEAFAS